MRHGLMASALAMWGAAAHAAPYPTDPLDSPMWTYHAKRIFGTDPVRFDPRVKIDVPEIAENQRVFPVTVDARGITQVRRILIFADLNPIPVAIDYRPTDAEPYVATRIKLDQRTPVRAAVQLESGEWLVSGLWVDAAGGGCSAPPVSRVKGDWAQHLGEVRGEAWPAGDGEARVRLAFRHPMDTGLVENIPAYHIESIVLKDARGRVLGDLAMQASVAEDPVVTLMPRAAAGAALRVDGRDTNGRTYAAALKVGAPPPVAIARSPMMAGR